LPHRLLLLRRPGSRRGHQRNGGDDLLRRSQAREGAAAPVVANPAPAKIDTAANTQRSKPSAAIPVNNILASNPEPVTVGERRPIVNAPAPDAAPVTTALRLRSQSPLLLNRARLRPPQPQRKSFPDGGPATTVAVSGITRVSDNRMRLSEEALKEYISASHPWSIRSFSKQMNVQGNVVMQLVISMEGKVKEVKVTSGAPQLQGTAVDSCRNGALPALPRQRGRPMESRARSASPSTRRR